MSVVSLSMEGAQGIAASLGQLSQSVEQLAQRQAANTRATMAGANASRNFAQSAQQSVQRIQGLANGIQSLVGHLGGENRTAGLVGSLAGTVAQFAAMGSMLGPAGTVIGGLAGLVAGVAGLTSELNDTQAAAARASEAIRTLAADRIAERNEARTSAGILTGHAGGLSEADLETRVEEARIRARDLAARVAAGVAGLADDPTSLAGIAARRSGRRAAAEEALESDRAALAAQNAIVDGVVRERNERAHAAREREHFAELEAADAAETRRAAAAAEEERRRVARTTRAAESARGGGGGPREFAGAAMTEEGLAASTSLTSDAEMARRASVDAARFEDTMAALATEREAHDASITETREAEAEKTALMRAADEERMADRRNAQADLEDFTRGEVGSLQSVIDAYRELQLTAKGTGVEVRNTGLLMSRSMTATGNTILDSVGNKMTGAFQEAVGAWLDGSKSFVEAAEGMAKGVIKALVMEGIVQAVVEGARSIASFASQDYAGGVAHAGAAAAWAAVAVVAGGVGAATGAFGGGGGAKTEGASQRDMASADRERQRGGEPGTMVVNVYADNLPVTQGDLDRVMTQMVRRGIERHGERFPGLSR